jgi:hypothetical protein
MSKSKLNSKYEEPEIIHLWYSGVAITKFSKEFKTGVGALLNTSMITNYFLRN